MNNIKKVSFYLRSLFQILFITLPFLTFISWLYAPEPLIFFQDLFRIDAIPEVYRGLHMYSKNALPQPVLLPVLSLTEKSLGFLISLIPTLIDLFILYSLIKLFKCYEQEEIFSLNNIGYIRNIAYGLLLSEMVNPIYQFFIGIILTFHNPPGHHFASISLSQTNIGMVLTAVLVILISWIMAEGLKLREEQQLTI